MKNIMRNCVCELTFHSKKEYLNPFYEVSQKLIVKYPDGNTKELIGFWDGSNVWKVRFSSSKKGLHKYISVCSDVENDALHGINGELEVTDYDGTNSLYLYGAAKPSQGGKHLVRNDDGMPFFWFADTWWMCFTSRLKWPDDFKMLAEDRVNKGFNVIQIVAGLYPDMEWFDERGANEAGFPWDKDFNSVNPEYFKLADEKIKWLCDVGLMPCIVGCWGFFIKRAGKEVIKKHWEYIIARWGAYPVAWCAAGEALMPFYNDTDSHNDLEAYRKEAKRGWTEITRYIKMTDSYNRLLTIHPGGCESGRDMIDDISLIDLVMLQTNHIAYACYLSTIKMVKDGVAAKPEIPLINSEVCYEGICGTCYADTQRFIFWACILNGACGHTYGANGIWQMNSLKKPYGPSPHGLSWGDTPWEEAYKLPGSKQLGLGKKLLMKYRWWKFENHPEWILNEGLGDNELSYFAAGVPGEVRFVFIHISQFATFWRGIVLTSLEKNIKYKAYWFDPVTGGETHLGYVSPDENGSWNAGRPNKLQDFLLIIEKEGIEL